MNQEREERRARQREEGQAAWVQYQQGKIDTLARMKHLREMRLAREMSDEESQERKIDEALEESFPASDPPSFVAR